MSPVRASKDAKAPRDTTAPPAPEPLPLAVADSHTHLDMQEASPAEIIAAAAAVNVRTLIQVGTDVASSRWGVELAESQPDVWATVALHPNEAPRIVLGDSADGWSHENRPPAGRGALDDALAEIDKLAGLDVVRGVGETGLDYFRTGDEGIAVQQDSFRAHIEIAKRRGIALMIHDRDAHADVLRILEEQGAPDTVVFHCYSGDAEMAAYCVERGYYLSFAGNVTYKPNQRLRDALAIAPLDRILVETDAPFLTPVPFRGRANAPYLVPVTVHALAAVRAGRWPSGAAKPTEPLDTATAAEEAALRELCAALAANTARAFGLASPAV